MAVARTSAVGKPSPVWLAAVAVVVLIPALALSLRAGGAEDRNREWRFVEKVLLTSEFDGPIKGLVMWDRPITLQVIDAREQDMRFIAEFVVSLNQVLSGTRVKFRIEDIDTAEMSIKFAPTGRFREIAEYLGAEYTAGGYGISWIWSEPGSKAARAISLVGQNLEIRDRHSTIAQELTQMLGPGNDSPLFPDSVMYEKEYDLSTATELAAIDRKLLRFVYRHLKPGDDVRAVRTAFDMYWDSVPSD